MFTAGEAKALKWLENCTQHRRKIRQTHLGEKSAHLTACCRVWLSLTCAVLANTVDFSIYRKRSKYYKNEKSVPNRKQPSRLSV